METATTSGTARVGTDSSTSHEMKCTIEQKAFTLTGTGAPQSAAEQGTCTAGNQKTDTAGKETRVKPEEMPITPPTPHNTVPGSGPYSEVVHSRTVPMITSEGEDKVRRNTAGNQAREGNDGKPDIVSVNENNGLSSPPASYASETQNHIDNMGDPSTNGEAGSGST